MRVNLAAQVLSRTVAAGIFTHSSLGLLSPEAVHTADFIYKIDQLFDLFNSATKEHYKEFKGALKNSTGHLHFIDEMIKYIQSWQIYTTPNTRVYCISGWISNLYSLKMLWNDIKSSNVLYLLTRRLNQDCLENLFATVRNRFGNSDHPSPTNFRLALKSIVSNSLLQPPPTANCRNELIPFLREINITEGCDTDSITDKDIFRDLSVEDEDDPTPLIEYNSAEENALTYVIGYACHKYLKKHTDCSWCKKVLCEEENAFDDYSKIFSHFKAEEKHDSLFGRLIMPKSEVLNTFRNYENFFRNNINKCLSHKSISQSMCKLLVSNIKSGFELCSKENERKFILKFIKMRIFFHIKQINKDHREQQVLKRKNKKLNKVIT